MEHYKESLIESKIAELQQVDGFEYLFDKVHETLYSRLKLITDVDGSKEIFYVMKGLKEVQAIIQQCVNDAHDDEPIEEDLV